MSDAAVALTVFAITRLGRCASYITVFAKGFVQGFLQASIGVKFFWLAILYWIFTSLAFYAFSFIAFALLCIVCRSFVFFMADQEMTPEEREEREREEAVQYERLRAEQEEEHRRERELQHEQQLAVIREQEAHQINPLLQTAASVAFTAIVGHFTKRH